MEPNGRRSGWGGEGQVGRVDPDTLLIRVGFTEGEGEWHPQRFVLENSSPCRGGDYTRGGRTRHCPRHLTRLSTHFLLPRPNEEAEAQGVFTAQ